VFLAIKADEQVAIASTENHEITKIEFLVMIRAKNDNVAWHLCASVPFGSDMGGLDVS
jgi:hypothetical protein